MPRRSLLRTVALAVAACSACGVDAATTRTSPDDPLAFATRAAVPADVELIPFVVADVRFTTTVVRSGDPHLYALDQSGRVLRIEPPSIDDLAYDGSLSGPIADASDLVVSLDIVDTTESAGEEGLLGLAFDPTGERAVVHHSRSGDGHSVIAEYAVDPDGIFVAASRRELFVVEQFGPTHNAGQLAFGPDGMLYAAFGDGSDNSDMFLQALDMSSPLGKILRIDPTPTEEAEYSVPADNPFVDVDGADPRIWSLGLRNPFSFSFDAHTGDMWVADVGQARFEEVNFSIATNGLEAGRGVDYGWSRWEAVTPFRLDQESVNHQPPRFFYAHEDAAECGAVADGLVVRDARITSLDGWYTYGDWCSGIVWARDTRQLDAPPVVLGNLPAFTQMVQTDDGNLYVSSQRGTIALVSPLKEAR